MSRCTHQLYITRKFPPSLGGMETLAGNIWEAIRSIDPGAILIAHRGSVRTTLMWLPAALVKLIVALLRRRVDGAICGDVLLYACVGPLLRAARVPHGVVAHGLDVTYDHSVYRRLVLPQLRRAPLVLVISEATGAVVRSAGVSGDRIRQFTLGIPIPETTDVDAARSELRRQLGVPNDSLVVATVGRLVRRKGVAWFIDEVLPSLPDNCRYVIAGEGPDETLIADAVDRRRLGDRVHRLGRVDDRTRVVVMSGCDVFAQPNIAVPGDIEGFGLVAVEAAVCGSFVVAADLEGLRDAVVDGVTGDLLPSGDREAWITHLRTSLADPDLGAKAERRRAECVERFSTRVMAEQLSRILRESGITDDERR